MILSSLLGAAAVMQTAQQPSEPVTLLVNYVERPSDAEVDWYRAQGATVKYLYDSIPTLAGSTFFLQAVENSSNTSQVVPVVVQ